jgi:hypothetical protein
MVYFLFPKPCPQPWKVGFGGETTIVITNHLDVDQSFYTPNQYQLLVVQKTLHSMQKYWLKDLLWPQININIIVLYPKHNMQLKSLGALH